MHYSIYSIHYNILYALCTMHYTLYTKYFIINYSIIFGTSLFLLIYLLLIMLFLLIYTFIILLILLLIYHPHSPEQSTFGYLGIQFRLNIIYLGILMINLSIYHLHYRNSSLKIFLFG